jgi:hypothetical protein
MIFSTRMAYVSLCNGLVCYEDLFSDTFKCESTTYDRMKFLYFFTRHTLVIAATKESTPANVKP